jgi:repressor LexA
MPAVLTDTERKILDYMARYLRANTYQPSIREIGEEFGIKSTKTVSEYLQGLARKGYLERHPSRSRGVRILGLDLSPQTVSIPCYPGLPDSEKGYAADGVEAYLTLDRRMSGAKGCYFVRVRSDDFQGAGFEEGDLFLVEPAVAAQLKEGELAVIRLEDGPQLVRLQRSSRGLTLRSGRTGAEVGVVESPDRLTVTGRVTALYRRMDGVPVSTSPTAH